MALPVASARRIANETPKALLRSALSGVSFVHLPSLKSQK